jgi:lysophospholipase L1-like esterase
MCARALLCLVLNLYCRELPDGPDHVWYTAGGNDFAEEGYQRCANAAKTMAAALECAQALFKTVRNCTQSLLEYYWKQVRCCLHVHILILDLIDR